MAFANIRINSGDFDWVRAPLASMEDLSVVNTPIPTPTAGQSPKTKARWSHRSSSGMTLDNMLGPINELGEDEHEFERINNQEDKDHQLINDENQTSRPLGSTASLPINSLNLHPLNSQSSSGAPQNQGLNDITDKNSSTNDYIPLCNAVDMNGDDNHPILHFVSGNGPLSNKFDISKNTDQNDFPFTMPNCNMRANGQENTGGLIRQADTPNDKNDDHAPLDEIKGNFVTSCQANTNEDPFSHIQWPKSAYQLDGNYAKSMPPYSTSLIPQKSQESHTVSTYKLMAPSNPRWRTCDVIPEEENMQILDSSQYNEKYSKYRAGHDNEIDTLLLRPRQVQFISPKHRRKHLRQNQIIRVSENTASISSSGVSSSQRIFGQPKQISPEMASLIRANDGSIDSARCHIEPKDRCLILHNIAMLFSPSIIINM